MFIVSWGFWRNL